MSQYDRLMTIILLDRTQKLAEDNKMILSLVLITVVQRFAAQGLWPDASGNRGCESNDPSALTPAGVPRKNWRQALCYKR